jgi:hypothetical protein
VSNASIRDDVSHLQFSDYLASPKTTAKKKSRARFQQEIIQSYGLCEEPITSSCQKVGSKPAEKASKSHRVASSEPSIAEIHLEIEKMKMAGLMTEIPARTNFVSSAEQPSSSFSRSSSDSRQPEILIPSDSSPYLVPYWTVSTLACIWLVYSMTSSLPGHWFWNLLIAIAFEFTPMLMLGARVEKKYQKTVSLGAIGIFLVGLGLYLAPSIQTLKNESSTYLENSDRYEADTKEYETRRANGSALVNSAKLDSERSAATYDSTLKSYGENSWRTAAAKKQKISDAAEWKRLSVVSESAKAPLAPKISDELTKAAQAIATRIGLFAVVFLSMFVMRRLEEPKTA